MSSINSITVSGRIARDPEVRSLPSGTSVFENAVAVEHYKKDEDNTVSFVNFKVYGAFADLLGKKIQKGDLVTVAGRIQEDTWEAQDGTKRSKLEIVAQDVEGEFKFRPSDFSGATPADDSDAPAPAADDDIPF